jgi:hypothetical protein
MANTVIAVRSSGTAAATPSLGVIANGEIALNFADGIIYYKTSSNTLGSIRTTQPAGLTTEVQYNDAGSFGANANFTFNKTIATLNVKNINVSTNLVTSTLTATTITTGTGVGGIIAGANVIYSNIFVANSTTTSTSNSTGAIISNGGLGVKGNVYADAIYDGGVEVIAFANAAFNKANSALANTGTSVTANNLTQYIFANTTASTSNTTGVITVSGGVGVKGNVSANGIIFDDGTRQTTAAAGGATVGDILALAIALG